MYTNIEKSAIENAIKIIFNDLTAVQDTLEELCRSSENQFSRQAISNDVEAVKAVVNEISLVLLTLNETASTTASRSNDSQKLVSLLRQYQDLLDKIRSKYRDFISDEIYHNLKCGTLEIEFKVRFMVALNHLVPVEDIQRHSKGMLLLSEALEYGISLSEDHNSSLFSENDWLEPSKNIAMTMLSALEASEVSKQLPASQDNLEELEGVIAYKNAARSILWQIDNFEKTANTTSQNLSHEEEIELVREANRAMMEAWDLISQRQNNGTDAQDNL